MNTTTDFQREILADGNVTFAEYEKATLAAIGCIEGGGIPGVYVDGPTARSGDDRFLEWSVAWSGNAEEDEFQRIQNQIGVLKRQCQDEYQRDVSRVWEYQNLLKPAQRDQLKPQVIECLINAGADLDRNATYEDIFRTVAEGIEQQEIQDCHQKFESFFVAGVE